MSEFQQRVFNYVMTLGVDYTPLRMAELATGVVAVEDANRECDAYFDITLWRFTHPEIWEAKKDLNKLGLEVLEGLGCFPPKRKIEDMAIFARKELISKWHDQPKFLEF